MNIPFNHPELNVAEALYAAQKIAFSPMTFQAVRLAWKRGLLESLAKNTQGLTPTSLAEKC